MLQQILSLFRRRPTLEQQVRDRSNELQLKLLESQLSLYDQLVDPREYLYDTPDFFAPVGSEEGIPPNLDQRRRGEVLPVYRTEYGLKLIRDQSRHLFATNEFAINAAENRVSYICGKGFQYQVVRRDAEPGKGPDELTAAAQKVLDRFIALNAWGEREQEAIRRCDRDGECFLRFFHLGQGRCVVRFVEPEHVRSGTSEGRDSFGVRTDSEDVEGVEGYWVVEEPWSSWTPSFVEACDVLHVRLNVDSTAKRGLPTFYPVRKNLQRAEALLRNMSIMAQVQASYAVIRKHKSYSKDAILAFQQDKANNSWPDPFDPAKTRYLQRMLPGSIIDSTDQTEYEFPSAQVNAGGLVDVLQAELRAVASRLVMPEYMLTADASNNNYASSLVAEAPAVKHFERLQACFARHFGDGGHRGLLSGVMWRVLRCAVEYGDLPREVLSECKIQAEGPSLVVRDRNQETTRHKVLSDSGVLSKATWSKLEGLDRDQEKAQIATEGGMQQLGQGDDGDSFGGGQQQQDDDGEEGPGLFESLLESDTYTDDSGTERYKANHREVKKDDGDSAGGSHFARWAGLAKQIPHKVYAKAVEKAKGYYTKLESRYGRKTAIAIMAAGVAGIPIPAPGASFVTAAPVIAIAEAIHRWKWRTGGEVRESLTDDDVAAYEALLEQAA